MTNSETLSCMHCGKDNPPDVKFCVFCGAKFRFCPNCGRKITIINRFCPFCGCPQDSTAQKLRRWPQDFYKEGIPIEKPRSVLWTILGLICFVSLGIFSLIIVINTLFIIPTFIASLFLLQSGTLPLYPLYMLYPNWRVRVQGLPLLVYVLITFSILIGSIVSLFAQDRRNIVETVKQAVSNFKKPVFFNSRSEERPKSIFVNVAQFFAVSWFFNIILLPISNPFDFQLFPSIGELPSLLFALTVAPVWEEIFFRGVCLGIPLLVVGAGFSKGTSKTSLKDYIVGGYQKEGLTGLQVIFIVISAALFGWAHVPGWGLWKFFPTFIAGLAFGYLFLTRGLHAAILFHFAVDYLGAIVMFLSSLTFPDSGAGLETLVVNWNLLPILMVFLLIVLAGIIFWFISGVWATGNYIIGIIEFLKKPRSSNNYSDLKSMAREV
ncbi:MAG: type II CAAX prenyl endopeptidase Rce1 family protein [Promethearchaeota archaeon]